MDTSTPPRASGIVNDEFEVDYDAGFETKWRRIELFSHAFMLLFVLAALGGLFGRGPLSHRTQSTPDGRLAVDFEPLTRWGTTNQVTLHLSAPMGDSDTSRAGAAADRVSVFVSSALEPLGLQQVLPQPNSTEAIRGGVAYAFDIAPGKETALVRFVLKPSVVGPVRVEARQGGETLSWMQVVLP